MVFCRSTTSRSILRTPPKVVSILSISRLINTKHLIISRRNTWIISSNTRILRELILEASYLRFRLHMLSLIIPIVILGSKHNQRRDQDYRLLNFNIQQLEIYCLTDLQRKLIIKSTHLSYRMFQVELLLRQSAWMSHQPKPGNLLKDNSIGTLNRSYNK
jgi:hypothetical protein